MAQLTIKFIGDDQIAGATKQVADDIRDVGNAADEAAPKGSGFFGGMLQAAGGFLAANVVGAIAGQFAQAAGSVLSFSSESAQAVNDSRS